MSWTWPWPSTLDDLETSYRLSQYLDRHMSAKSKNIDLEIGALVGNRPWTNKHSGMLKYGTTCISNLKVWTNTSCDRMSYVTNFMMLMSNIKHLTSNVKIWKSRYVVQSHVVVKMSNVKYENLNMPNLRCQILCNGNRNRNSIGDRDMWSPSNVTIWNCHMSDAARLLIRVGPASCDQMSKYENVIT